MRIVATFIIVFILLFSINILAAQDWQWSLAAKPDIEAGIYGISMLSDGKAGWGVGSDLKIGRIFHTTDGWKTWIDQTDTTVTKQRFSSVDFVDELHGWVVGEAGIILYTKDGGSSWAIQGAGVTSNNLNKLSTVDSDHAWAAGDKGTIVYTMNGTTWNLINTGITNPLYGIDMYNASHGVAVGKSQTAYYRHELESRYHGAQYRGKGFQCSEYDRSKQCLAGR